jgi:hypothetical protein
MERPQEQPIAQRGNGNLFDRMNNVRGNFDEWVEHEPAIPAGRMRHFQSGRVEHVLTVQDEIEIQSSRPPVDGADAATFVFDSMAQREQFVRGQSGVKFHGRVQKPQWIGCSTLADRCGLNEPADARDANFADVPQRSQTAIKRRCHISLIASQGQKATGHGNQLASEFGFRGRLTTQSGILHRLLRIVVKSP